MTIVFDTLSQVSGGLPGTAARLWTAVCTNTLEEVLEEGAISDYVDSKQVSVRDMIYVTYADGTEDVGIQEFQVAAGGSLIYPFSNEFQPYSDALTSLAGLTTVANEMIYLTAANTYATVPALAYGRGLLNTASAVDARSTLSAAVSGANGDITSLTGLSTPLSIAQGGTGRTTSNIIAQRYSFTEAGGSHDVTITGLTTSSVVCATLYTSANPDIWIDRVTADTNTLHVFFNATPGATVINVIAFIAAQ